MKEINTGLFDDKEPIAKPQGTFWRRYTLVMIYIVVALIALASRESPLSVFGTSAFIMLSLNPIIGICMFIAYVVPMALLSRQLATSYYRFGQGGTTIFVVINTLVCIFVAAFIIALIACSGSGCRT